MGMPLVPLILATMASICEINQITSTDFSDEAWGGAGSLTAPSAFSSESKLPSMPRVLTTSLEVPNLRDRVIIFSRRASRFSTCTGARAGATEGITNGGGAARAVLAEARPGFVATAEPEFVGECAVIEECGTEVMLEIVFTQKIVRARTGEHGSWPTCPNRCRCGGRCPALYGNTRRDSARWHSRLRSTRWCSIRHSIHRSAATRCWQRC